MILILLIAVPCILLAVTLVVLLDRMGMLSDIDGGYGESSGMLARVPRSALVGAMMLMGAWMLAWVVILIIGLGALST